ncbi:MAG: glycosyltransferase family 39 protein [Candidatus Limnocylindrales bacterium]
MQRIWPVAMGLPLLIGVAALVMGLGFGGLYGQDSFFYQSYATGAMRAGLPLSLLWPPDFTWPPGYPMLVAIASLLAGQDSLGGQIVSVIAGALVPVFAALLCRELTPRPRWVAPLAGLLVALSPHLWQSSAVVMSDTTGLAFATGGGWALARFARTGHAPWIVIAAVGLAFAIEVRTAYALVAVPLAVVAVVVARGIEHPIRRLAAAALVSALILAPMALPMLIAVAHGEHVPFAISLSSHGWDPFNAFRSSFDGPDGHFDFAQPMGLFYLLQPAQPYHLTPAFTLLSIVGGARTIRRPTAARVGTLVAWPVLMLGFLAGDTTQNTRFALAVLPPLAILAALGVAWIAEGIGRLQPRGRTVANVALATAVTLGLGVMAIEAVRFTSAFIVRQQADLAAVDRLAARVPNDARLLSFGATLQLRHDGRDPVDLYGLAPDEAVELVSGDRPTYLLVPLDGLGPQWADAPPGLVLAALRDGPGLIEAAADGAWRLFVVDRGPILAR